MILFPQRGGCFCGEVRYTLSEDPLTLYACHCTDCQRQTGSSFVLSMVVRREALKVLGGKLREYSLELPDGRRKHGKFCGRCSTRLWGQPVKLPGLAVLRPGTLDDTSWLHPIGHIWTQSAQPWVRIPDDTLNFSRQPEGDEVLALVRAWKQRTSK
ncbi:MAG: GFA family protein [Gemmatimonadota bacterium]